MLAKTRWALSRRCGHRPFQLVVGLSEGKSLKYSTLPKEFMSRRKRVSHHLLLILCEFSLKSIKHNTAYFSLFFSLSFSLGAFAQPTFLLLPYLHSNDISLLTVCASVVTLSFTNIITANNLTLLLANPKTKTSVHHKWLNLDTFHLTDSRFHWEKNFNHFPPFSLQIPLVGSSALPLPVHCR